MSIEAALCDIESAIGKPRKGRFCDAIIIAHKAFGGFHLPVNLRLGLSQPKVVRIQRPFSRDCAVVLHGTDRLCRHLEHVLARYIGQPQDCLLIGLKSDGYNEETAQQMLKPATRIKD